MRAWIGCAVALFAGAALAQTDGGMPDAGTGDAPFPELPQSPAFEALGTTPSDVLRPSSIRELGIDLAAAVDSGGTLKPGFSVETAPIWLAVGGGTMLKQWRDSYSRRLASWIGVSLASVGADDGGTSAAEGLRVVLHDGSDPRFDNELAECLDGVLKQSFESPPPDAGRPPAAATRSTTTTGKSLSSLNDALKKCRDDSVKRMSSRLTWSAAVAGAVTQHIKAGDTLPDDWARKIDAWASAAVNGISLLGDIALTTIGTIKFESDSSSSTKSVSSAVRFRAGDLRKALSVDASWKPTNDDTGWHNRFFTLSGRLSWPLFEKIWIEGSLGTYLGADRQGHKAFGSVRLKFNTGSE